MHYAQSYETTVTNGIGCLLYGSALNKAYWIGITCGAIVSLFCKQLNEHDTTAVIKRDTEMYPITNIHYDCGQENCHVIVRSQVMVYV